MKNDQQTNEQQQITNDGAGCFTNTQIHSAPGKYSIDKALAFTGDENKQNKKQEEIEDRKECNLRLSKFEERRFQKTF